MKLMTDNNLLNHSNQLAEPTQATFHEDMSLSIKRGMLTKLNHANNKEATALKPEHYFRPTGQTNQLPGPGKSITKGGHSQGFTVLIRSSECLSPCHLSRARCLGNVIP